MVPDTIVVNGHEVSSQQLQLAKALSLHLQIADREQSSAASMPSSALQQRIAIFNEILNTPRVTAPQQPGLSFDALLPVLNNSRDPQIKSALERVRMESKSWDILAAKEVSNWKARQMTLVSR